MRFAYKYRLYPNKAQVQFLENQLLSRRKRGSHRCRKAATLVAKAHRKIRNQRAAFHHEITRWLVEHYGLIAVEDLNIRELFVLSTR